MRIKYLGIGCLGPFLTVDPYIYAAEDYFTAKALGDVKALKDRNPEFALVLDDFDERKPPPLASVPHKQLPVKDVVVGAYVLVKAGEVCSIKASMLSNWASERILI